MKNNSLYARVHTIFSFSVFELNPLFYVCCPSKSAPGSVSLRGPRVIFANELISSLPWQQAHHGRVWSRSGTRWHKPTEQATRADDPWCIMQWHRPSSSRFVQPLLRSPGVHSIWFNHIYRGPLCSTLPNSEEKRSRARKISRSRAHAEVHFWSLSNPRWKMKVVKSEMNMNTIQGVRN